MENDRAAKALVWSTRALAALGGLALASTGECETPFLILFLSFFLLGLKIDDLPFLSRMMALSQPFLAAGVLMVAFVDFFFLSNSFLLSVAHFLLALQGVRLLVIKTNRENLGSVLISSMMMLSASTLAVEWTFFVMLFLFLPGVIWCLIVHNIASENPAEFERSLAWQELLPTLRHSAAAAFSVAAATCIVVFITFPRFNFQGFRGQFLQPVHRSGFSSQMDLNKSGRIFLDNSIVMRIEIAKADRENWSGYLRGATMDTTDGRTWRRNPIGIERIYRQSNGELHLPLRTRGEKPARVLTRGPLLRQSIYLESMDSAILFAAPRPAVFRTDRPFLEVARDGSVQRGLSDTWRLHYEVDSYVEPTINVGVRSPFPVAKRGQTPSTSKGSDPFSGNGDLTPLGALAAQISSKAKTPIETARRIENYLQTHYTYSLDLGSRSESLNPVEDFLFERKKGHCEYFASAMCLLLRERNIPSRLVTGFVGTEWNERGSYYVVRMQDAHAWVEAFIDGQGWVAFDPSPRDFRRPAAGVELLRNLNEMMDFLNLRWNRYILSYDLEKQVAIVRAVSGQSQRMSLRLDTLMRHLQNVFRSVRWGRRAPLNPEEMPSVPASRVELFGAISLLVGGTGLLFTWLHRRRSHGSVWFYPALVRFIEKKGGRLARSQTLPECIDLMAEKLGQTRGDVEFLQREYYRLRFDPESVVTPQEFAAIRSSVQRLR